MGKDVDLMQAVRNQDYTAVQKLLAKNRTSKPKLIGSGKRLNVNQQDEDGMSPLHQAALVGEVNIMKLLLDHEAQVDIKDNKGMRALHYASWQGKEDPVSLLLQHGSNVNEAALDGNTPLHLACEHGHLKVVEMLFHGRADPSLEDNLHKTALDKACEFGRSLVVELLLKSEATRRLLLDSTQDEVNNDRTTCLHLAAQNGHTEIVKLLIQAGVNINRQTPHGTCLHVAAKFGKVDVVRLLLSHGIDVNRLNSYEQTALEIVNKFTTSRAAKELKLMLKEAEANLGIRACAIQDYKNPHDSSHCSFKEGDHITVLERHPTNGLWKGYRYSADGYVTRPGYFPASAVVLIDSTMSRPRSGSQKSENQHSPLPSVDLTRYGGTVGEDSSFPMPPPLAIKSKASHIDGGSPHLLSANSGVYSVRNPYGSEGTNTHLNVHTAGFHPASSKDGNGDSLQFAGGKPSSSPTGSNRSSTASSGSGGYQNGGNASSANRVVYRLSGQSCESGVSGARVSYHSASSSSQGSLDHLEESGYSSTVNVHDLLEQGLSDAEILSTWLGDLHLEDQTQLFLQAGYDMPTISRMTPEDLTAIGISKPSVRKRLKTEIGKLSINDGIPDFKPPDVRQWLGMLHLEEYSETLVRQGYNNMDNITDITWEDLEEIGIKKLGHQKKIMLAIDKLKRLNSSLRRLSSSGGRTTRAEVLSPPSSGLFSDVTYAVPINASTGVPQNFGALNSMSPKSHYEDFYQRPMASSGEYINRIDSRAFPQNCPTSSPLTVSDPYGRSLTPIQIQVQSQPKPLPSLLRQSDMASMVPGRFSSLVDAKDQPFRGPMVVMRGRSGESDGDTTPTNERKAVTGTGEGKDTPLSINRYDAASVSPNFIDSSLKQRPVAKIIAKAKLNSHMMHMDIFQTNSEVGTESEPRSDPYSYNYSTLPRKFSAKRKIVDEHASSGNNWSDDSDLLGNRPHENLGIYSPSTAEFLNDLTAPQQSLEGLRASINQSELGLRNVKDAPAPPKRTNSFKTDLRAVYASVVDRTKHGENKNSYMGISSYDKINETEMFNNLSIAGDYRSPLVRTESDRMQSPRTLTRFNHELLRPKLSNRIDLASAESLRGAFERLEKHTAAQSEELNAAIGFSENKFALKNRENNAQVQIKGKETKLGDQESRVPSAAGTISRGGPKLGDWQDNRSTSSSGGDCSSDDSDSGLESHRSGSTVSLDSGSSSGATGDTNTLPFANENVGTIKQRNAALKPSIVADNGNDLNVDMFTDNMGTIKANRKPSVEITLNTEPDGQKGQLLEVNNKLDCSDNGNHSIGMNSDNVFNDIDGMLLGLTQELDAMLQLQS